MQTNPRKILIIEDDDVLRDILKDNLTDQGYAVTAAPNGKKGLKLFLSEQPDLILLDILLPDEDGLSVLQKIRADKSSEKQAKIIMLTNLSDSQSIATAVKLGAHSFLVKSDMKIEDLLVVIRKQLDY